MSAVSDVDKIFVFVLSTRCQLLSNSDRAKMNEDIACMRGMPTNAACHGCLLGMVRCRRKLSRKYLGNW